MNEYLLIFYRFAVLLLLYAAQRVAFYLYNADLFPLTEISQWPTFLAGGLKFDVSALAYLNLPFAVFYVLAFRFKFNKVYGRVTDGIFYACNGVGIAMNCADFAYYRFILRRTTSNVFDILANETNTGSLWLQFAADYWHVFLCFAAFMALLVCACRPVKPKPTPVRGNAAYGAVGVGVMALIAFLAIGGIRGDWRHSTRPINSGFAARYANRPEEAWIVLNTPFTFIRSIGKKGFQKLDYYTEEELAALYTPESAGKPARPFERKNLVVFILESFSREFVGSLNTRGGDADPIVALNDSAAPVAYAGYTPFLDSLARHSLSFTQAYANGRKSIDAMPSILASIPSLTLPYITTEYSNNAVCSLASVLGAKGYRTAFFHGAPNGSMGFDAFARAAKFQTYYGRDEYEAETPGGADDYDGIWGIWDHKFFGYYARKISQMQEPFCAAVFSLSSHHPFRVHPDFEGRFPKGPMPLDECVGYTDNALREFFAYAKTQPWYANTLFVITADHSITPEHDEYRNNAQAFAVPLIFHCPADTSLRGWDNATAQQADIMPTALSYLGVSEPYVAFGCDLLSTDCATRFAMNFNNGLYQYFRRDTMALHDGQKLVALYDLRCDPDQRHNILQPESANPDKNITDKTLAGAADRFDRWVKAYLQQYNNRMVDNRLTPQSSPGNPE